MVVRSSVCPVLVSTRVRVKVWVVFKQLTSVELALQFSDARGAVFLMATKCLRYTHADGSTAFFIPVCPGSRVRLRENTMCP